MTEQNKTVETAAQLLPEDCRESFLRAWEATNCVDLYEGVLGDYLCVIAEVLERKQLMIKKAKELVTRTHIELTSIEDFFESGKAEK